jgi:outer membrane protein assembly factor BamB
MSVRALPIVLAFLVSGSTRAADWPQWRGPTGQGQTQESKLPLTWDGKTGENVAWKAPLPKGDFPYSSPIVQGGRVFATVAMNKTREQHVLCFDAKDGKQLWDTPVPPGPWELKDPRAGYAAPTPCADAERVYVLFGSAVLAALDRDGKILWRRDLPKYNFDVQVGTSPLPVGDTIVVECDLLAKQGSLIAFDKQTGDVRWDAKRPENGFAHSTPTPVTIGERPALLVAGSDTLQAVSSDNGAVIWSCRAKGDTVSPVYADGVAYLDSGRGGPGFAVAVDAAMTGDVTKAALKWSIKHIPEGFGSPVIVGPRLYRIHAPGILKCYALADGAEVFSQRLEGATAAASPIVTKDGLIYCASSGKSYVIKAGPKFEQLAANNLDDPNYASPAVADGHIFLKGQKFLYCIGPRAD